MRAAEGQEPVIAGSNWSLPGELGIYSEGQPQAVSLGPVFNDRHSQYDLWPGPLVTRTIIWVAPSFWSVSSTIPGCRS